MFQSILLLYWEALAPSFEHVTRTVVSTSPFSRGGSLRVRHRDGRATSVNPHRRLRLCALNVELLHNCRSGLFTRGHLEATASVIRTRTLHRQCCVEQAQAPRNPGRLFCLNATAAEAAGAETTILLPQHITHDHVSPPSHHFTSPSSRVTATPAQHGRECCPYGHAIAWCVSPLDTHIRSHARNQDILTPSQMPR